MTQSYFIIDGAGSVKEAGRDEWERFTANESNWIVRQDRIGYLFVSTIFLGYDEPGKEEPELYETLVRDSDGGVRVIKHRTRKEAIHAHRLLLSYWLQTILN